MMTSTKKRGVWAPLAVLGGLITVCLLAAVSDVFTPLIRFVHTNRIVPFEAFLCIVFMVAGFWLCHLLLNFLCSYFVPRLDDKAGHQEHI